ncbi:MAG TPA: NAD(P)H-dependent oxidoreductase, partial [Chitinophagaceae bacterium]|nr:NAD(P)H-dependent oxidoreductase [Chitinophagaceae bacterium]
MRIEILSGSPRVNSVTRRVALHLHSFLKASTDHEIGLLDLADWDLPYMQSVFTSVQNTPDEWKPLSQRIFDADAFILVSPEYNG